jgi:hypothetical protein
MRLFVASLLLTAGPIAAQENAPIGILRGDLVEWSGTLRGGRLTFRTAGNRVLECSFDERTWFEHENERIIISGMRAGDHLELVADRLPPSTTCYARTVQILDATIPRRTASGKPPLKIHNSATELLAPRGDMTFSGIVLVMNGDWLTLRTRDKGRQVLLLRPDTRYLGGGLPLDRSNLDPQTRVYVRAGRNLDGDVEAYTIVWGEILEVHD